MGMNRQSQNASDDADQGFYTEKVEFFHHGLPIGRLNSDMMLDWQDEMRRADE